MTKMYEYEQLTSERGLAIALQREMGLHRADERILDRLTVSLQKLDRHQELIERVDDFERRSSNISTNAMKAIRKRKQKAEAKRDSRTVRLVSRAEQNQASSAE
jgi:hypothetical protein